MRIVSLLASGTEIVCALGAGDQLVGRSHECDYPEWVRDLPACTEPAFPVTLSSREIDAEVNRRIRIGEPLYHAHTELISSLNPDLLITQSHCQVCAVTPADVERAAGGSLVAQNVVSLSANSLADIHDGILRISAALGRSELGRELVPREQARLEAVRQRTAHRARPTVVVLEWTDPLFAMGNWGPELVLTANGQPLLATPGQYSHTVTWEDVRNADPDYLIVSPCGFDLARSLAERPVLEANPGWQELRAVREGRLFFADGNRYFNRSGMTVTDTAEIIAEILHGPDHSTQITRWEGTAWVPAGCR